ncbi:MAG: hypothetical protein WC998_00640 [Candidatus Paceibacterota bacterium]|jgi:hypothetical protein
MKRIILQNEKVTIGICTRSELPSADQLSEYDSYSDQGETLEFRDRYISPSGLSNEVVWFEEMHAPKRYGEGVMRNMKVFLLPSFFTQNRFELGEFDETTN